MKRWAIALVAVITIVIALCLSWPEGGPASSSLFPRLSMQDFQTCQRSNPRQALLCLAGRCQGDWRRLAEPARYVWVTLKNELTGEQPGNPAAPTATEIAAAYAAMGLEVLDRSPTSLRSNHEQVAAARDRYIVANASAFTP